MPGVPFVVSRLHYLVNKLSLICHMDTSIYCCVCVIKYMARCLRSLMNVMCVYALDGSRLPVLACLSIGALPSTNPC